jgi:hypothetical protein
MMHELHIDDYLEPSVIRGHVYQEEGIVRNYFAQRHALIVRVTSGGNYTVELAEDISLNTIPIGAKILVDSCNARNRPGLGGHIVRAHYNGQCISDRVPGQEYTITPHDL